MTRLEAIALVHDRLRMVAAEFSVLPIDDYEHYYTPTTLALRRLGVSWTGIGAATVTDATADDFLAWLTFEAICHFQNMAAPQVDVQLDEIRAARSQLFDHLKQMKLAAEDALVALGYDPSGAMTVTVQPTMTFDPYLPEVLA